WERLAAPDPGLAYPGMASLAAAPAEAVAILRAPPRPAAVPTEGGPDRAGGRLDGGAPAGRGKGSAGAARFRPNRGGRARGAPGGRAGAASAEARRRLTQFLRRHDTVPSPYHLRCVRGVATLEALGTAEARTLLAALAKGPADDLLTREARAASRRGGEGR